MKNPNLMSDEELAVALETIGAGFWFDSNKAIMGEAAARLREHTELRESVKPTEPERNPSGFELLDGRG